MKQIFFILFLFTMSLLAKPYSAIISGSFEDVLFDITQDYNGEISAVGFSQNYRQDTDSNQLYNSAFEYLDSISSQNGEQLRLIRLNSQAKISFDFSNKLPKFNRGVSVVKTKDNGYFIGGYTQDGELLLLRLSNSGSIVFQREFGTKNYDRMNTLVALRDGGVLAVGSSMTSRSRQDSRYTQGIGLNDIYLTRFNQQGNILWSKKYGTRADDRGIDATEAFDGTLLILANSSKNSTQSITLMRLTEEGDKIWLHQYGTKGVLNAHKLITLKDNNFLTSISYYDKNHTQQTRLIKFDLQKNLLQEHNITTDGINILNDIKERSNGAIVGVGEHTTRLKTEAMAITLDNHLKPIWQRFFDNFERSSFHALSLLHNGDIAIAGELTKKGNEIRDMWIIKLHRDGSTSQTTSAKSSLYDLLCKTFAKEIKDKKISISKDLSINLIAPELNFKVGKYHLNQKQKSFLHNFNKKLIDILYQYKESIKALHVNGHTSSEWGSLIKENSYIKNMKLSNRRSFEVLKFIYNTQSSKYKKFLTKILSANGYSYSKAIIKNNLENKKISRRVNFKIFSNKN